MNPLELGKGHGIVGDAVYVDAVRGRYLSGDADMREIPAARSLTVRPDTERIIGAVCAETRVSREAMLQKGFRGPVRGLLMELLYRHGGMKQREIGALLGVDYSAVSVSRKRLQASMHGNPKLRAIMARVGERIGEGPVESCRTKPGDQRGD